MGGRLEITEQTCCCWRQEFCGLQMDLAKRSREIEKENANGSGWQRTRSSTLRS